MVNNICMKLKVLSVALFLMLPAYSAEKKPLCSQEVELGDTEWLERIEGLQPTTQAYCASKKGHYVDQFWKTWAEKRATLSEEQRFNAAIKPKELVKEYSCEQLVELEGITRFQSFFDRNYVLMQAFSELSYPRHEHTKKQAYKAYNKAFWDAHEKNVQARAIREAISLKCPKEKKELESKLLNEHIMW